MFKKNYQNHLRSACAVRHSPSAVRRPSSAVRRLPSAVCRPEFLILTFNNYLREKNMKFISEKNIDAAAEEIGASETAFKAATLELSQEQPVIAAYLFSENFDLFTSAEKEYLLFLTLVIFKAIKKVNGVLKKTPADTFGKIEEKNWVLLNEVTSKKFRDRLDVFFKNYDQEDLLAFVEDSLTEEEEELVTKVGRESMFVTLKSIIDCWCDSSQ